QPRSDPTFRRGDPFPLLPGATDDGETVVTALRVAQEFVHRTPSQVFALRSRFSFGLDALGATVNSDPDVPDGRFFAWLGQPQCARRLPVLDREWHRPPPPPLTPRDSSPGWGRPSGRVPFRSWTVR